MHPIAYEDKRLNDATLYYPIYEKKLLIIKEILKKWEYYIENEYMIMILINHEFLKYMNSIMRLSKWLIKWIDKFQEYNLNIQYWKKSETVILNVFSRWLDFLNVIS